MCRCICKCSHNVNEITVGTRVIVPTREQAIHSESRRLYTFPNKLAGRVGTVLSIDRSNNTVEVYLPSINIPERKIATAMIPEYPRWYDIRDLELVNTNPNLKVGDIVQKLSDDSSYFDEPELRVIEVLENHCRVTFHHKFLPPSKAVLRFPKCELRLVR